VWGLELAQVLALELDLELVVLVWGLALARE